jgi:hypothetical protein
MCPLCLLILPRPRSTVKAEVREFRTGFRRYSSRMKKGEHWFSGLPSHAAVSPRPCNRIGRRIAGLFFKKSKIIATRLAFAFPRRRVRRANAGAPLPFAAGKRETEKRMRTYAGQKRENAGGRRTFASRKRENANGKRTCARQKRGNASRKRAGQSCTLGQINVPSTEYG